MKFTEKNNKHQGDCQFFSIDSLPKEAIKIAKTFIAKSERSGHAHALCGSYELYELPETEAKIIKVNDGGCTLNHTAYHNLTAEYWDKNQVIEVADHKPTTFEPGIYFVGIQKVKKHFSKIWNKVKD